MHKLDGASQSRTPPGPNQTEAQLLPWGLCAVYAFADCVDTVSTIVEVYCLWHHGRDIPCHAAINASGLQAQQLAACVSICIAYSHLKWNSLSGRPSCGTWCVLVLMLTSDTLTTITGIACLQSTSTVSQGGTSLQHSASCKVHSARPSAAQVAQEIHSSADDTSSSLSQPLSGSPLSAVCRVALPSPALVTEKEQLLNTRSEACSSTAMLQPAETSSTSAGSGWGESDSLQQLQQCELGTCQERNSGSFSHTEFPEAAAAEAWQSSMCDPPAESLNERAAAAMQHGGVVQLNHHFTLLSTQMFLDGSLLPDTEDASDTPSQSTSEVDAETSVQHQDNGAYAAGNLVQHQFVGSVSGYSSSESECSSPAELDAAAAGCDRQAGWPLAVSGAIPKSSWLDRPPSSDDASESSSGDDGVKQLTASSSISRY